MLTSAEIKKKLEKVFGKRQAAALSEVLVDAYGELVKSSDFNELKAIVKELAEAQARTEQRVGELAEAQKRTEQRVEELAEVQKEGVSRITRLEVVVEELAEAQKRTEERLGRLEGVVGQLAQTQGRTEEALQRLVQEHLETRRQVGGISMTIGYTLENEAFRALPALLQKDFGIVVKGRLKRQYVTDREGKPLEVNILGEGQQDGKELVIIGESKGQLSKNDVDAFIRRRLHRLEGVFKDVFSILVTHMTTDPEVEEYAKEKGIALYYSYDF